MFDLFIGIEAARRRTEELLAYDQPAPGKARRPRRGHSWPRTTVSMLLAALRRTRGPGVRGSRTTVRTRTSEDGSGPAGLRADLREGDEPLAG
jgi:hypothetical protein